MHGSLITICSSRRSLSMIDIPCRNNSLCSKQLKHISLLRCHWLNQQTGTMPPQLELLNNTSVGRSSSEPQAAFNTEAASLGTVVKAVSLDILSGKLIVTIRTTLHVYCL